MTLIALIVVETSLRVNRSDNFQDRLVNDLDRMKYLSVLGLGRSSPCKSEDVPRREYETTGLLCS